MVNPYLERALGGYQRKQMHRHLIALVAAGVAVVFAVAYVLLANPEDGWFCNVSGLLLIPGTLGIVVCGSLAIGARKVPLLAKLRTGIAIRRVRRDVTTFEMRRGLIRVERKVPTIFVDFTDGKTLSVLSLGDTKQFLRIDELLRKQQEQQSART